MIKWLATYNEVIILLLVAVMINLKGSEFKLKDFCLNEKLKLFTLKLSSIKNSQTIQKSDEYKMQFIIPEYFYKKSKTAMLNH